MANSGRVEINSSVTDSLRSVHGVIYVIFYGRIRIPRISGNFGACADSVYQALLSAHEREPGFEASAIPALLVCGGGMIWRWVKVVNGTKFNLIKKA